MNESSIVYERGPYWVFKGRHGQRPRAYVVFGPCGHVASISDSAYPPTTDGLSIAKARVDYLAARAATT